MSMSNVKNEDADDSEQTDDKIEKLWSDIENSNAIVVLTGPGISTSQGIPESFHTSTDPSTFDNESNELEIIEKADASYAHCFVALLEMKKKLDWIISENTDDLQYDCGYLTKNIIQVHGNHFREQCNHCKRVYKSGKVLQGYGLLPTGKKCKPRKKSRPCRGYLYSTRVNWEEAYTRNDLKPLYDIIRNSDMVLCIGTSFERPPFNFLVKYAIKHVEKVASINAHKTSQDEKLSFVIHGEPDVVCRLLNRKRKAILAKRKSEREEMKASNVAKSPISQSERTGQESRASGKINDGDDDVQATSSSSTKCFDNQSNTGQFDTVRVKVEDDESQINWVQNSEKSDTSGEDPSDLVFTFEGCKTPTELESVEELSNEASTSENYKQKVNAIIARLSNVTKIVSTSSVTTCEVNQGASTSKSTEPITQEGN